jgi:hypothetical protein
MHQTISEVRELVLARIIVISQMIRQIILGILIVFVNFYPDFLNLIAKLIHILCQSVFVCHASELTSASDTGLPHGKLVKHLFLVIIQQVLVLIF